MSSLSNKCARRFMSGVLGATARVRLIAAVAVLITVAVPAAVAAESNRSHAPRVVPPIGRVYDHLSAAWWQYALEQPFTTGPLTDPTGAGCLARSSPVQCSSSAERSAQIRSRVMSAPCLRANCCSSRWSMASMCTSQATASIRPNCCGRICRLRTAGVWIRSTPVSTAFLLLDSIRRGPATAPVPGLTSAALERSRSPFPPTTRSTSPQAPTLRPWRTGSICCSRRSRPVVTRSSSAAAATWPVRSHRTSRITFVCSHATDTESES